jgi:hypothetical protein
MKYLEGRIKEPSSWAAVAAGIAAVAVFVDEPWVLVLAVAAGVVGFMLKERKA